jgi:hypothetical protein
MQMMASRKFQIQDSKISPNFTSRLEKLSPNQKVRAIVLLNLESGAEGKTKRLSSAERKAAMESVRQSAQFALPEIDEILQSFEGKRLSDEVNALGSVAVETTAAGIISLAQSDRVKAILEDQPISLLH